MKTAFDKILWATAIAVVALPVAAKAQWGAKDPKQAQFDACALKIESQNPAVFKNTAILYFEEGELHFMKSPIEFFSNYPVNNADKNYDVRGTLPFSYETFNLMDGSLDFTTIFSQVDRKQIGTIPAIYEIKRTFAVPYGNLIPTDRKVMDEFIACGREAGFDDIVPRPSEIPPRSIPVPPPNPVPWQ